MSKPILVTGGAGYVGSHACKALARAGYTPICYDSLERGHAWAVKWGPLEKGDILDRKRLEEVLQKYRPIAVMHFAAYAYVEESVREPDKYFRNNVHGSLNVLEAIQACDVNKFIFSSSCAVYGMPKESPLQETHPIAPINPYGAGKATVEKKLMEFRNSSPLRYISLRYFNAAGADADGEIGEAHTPETHLIPLVLNAAGNPRETIKIYGDDYDTPDGTCVRDYIHVEDLADGHLRALYYLERGNESDIINLGTGSGYSVKEIIQCARDITSRNIIQKIMGRRAGDPPCLVANRDYAEKTIGWKPRYSQIENIIATAWKWHSRKS